MNPPAYEEINSETVLLPPSTTLISVYSEPIRIEYEENERIHQAGCGKLLWNYYACCGYVKEDLFETINDTNFRIYWTLIGCFCCILPFMILLIIFSFYSESLLSESRSLLSADFFNLRGT